MIIITTKNVRCMNIYLLGPKFCLVCVSVFGFLVIEGSKEGGREQRLSHDSMTTNTFNDASDKLNKVSTDEPISTLISQKANQMLKRCGLVSYTHIRTNCLTNRRKESKSIRLDHQNDDFDRRCFVST